MNFMLMGLVDTGEEGEEVHFSSRARLYFFDGAWKERGTGVFKLNIRTAEDENTESTEADPEAQVPSGKRKARLLMRADATHKVLLNSPVFKGMKFGAADGTEPTGKLMHLQALENGKPLPLQIKVSTVVCRVLHC
jgi:Ran-binding protein 3